MEGGPLGKRPTEPQPAPQPGSFHSGAVARGRDFDSCAVQCLPGWLMGPRQLAPL